MGRKLRKIRNLQQLPNGSWEARKAVPAKHQARLGRKEFTRVLGTDAKQAKRDLHGVLAEWEAELAQVRGATPKNDKDAAPVLSDEAARRFYEGEMAFDEFSRNIPRRNASEDLTDLLIAKLETEHFGAKSDPATRDEDSELLFNYEADKIRGRLSSRIGFGTGTEMTYHAQVRNLRRVISGAAADDEIEDRVGWAILDLQISGDLPTELDVAAKRVIGRQLGTILLDVLETSHRRDKGDYSGDPALPKVAHVAAKPTKENRSEKAVSLSALFEDYVTDLQREGRGRDVRSRWTRTIDSLRAFVKHNDAVRLTRKNILEWRDDLLKTLSIKTVRSVYLAAVGAVLQFGFDNDRLTSNVAAGIKMRTKGKPQTREKGLTHAEALAVLRVAKTYEPKYSKNPRTRESQYRVDAKRWVPWLLAFTGARVVEICQLRKCDILREEGIDFIRITPDAGSVKDSKPRDVPIHLQLIDLGFLEFVKGKADGPLFLNPDNQDSVKAARDLSGRLTKWIRDQDLIGKDVSPHHGWRHRFKTISWDAGLEARIVDAIQGHAARTSGENYGDVSLQARAAAISKLSFFDIAVIEY